jgi:hypothetical protein
MIILVNNKFFCRKFELNHGIKLIFTYFFKKQSVLWLWRLVDAKYNLKLISAIMEGRFLIERMLLGNNN